MHQTNRIGLRSLLASLLAAWATWSTAVSRAAEPLLAGVARIDITNPQAERVNDPCFAKALVLRQGKQSVAIVTVDAVAIGGIGSIRDSFLDAVRKGIAQDPGIPAENLLVNASHCHGNVRSDSEQLVIAAIRQAAQAVVPVRVAVGQAREERISENRRVTLHDGSQVDMRRAYSFAWDKQIASTGPIDPDVGIVRLDRVDGRPLALLYHFACHPIMNPPSKGSSADYPGFASPLIENALGHGATAFFLQGCGGDINPVRYKEVNRAPDAEPLGTLLGATIVARLASLAPVADAELVMRKRSLALPRAADFQSRIDALEAERLKLVGSLKSTNINFKTFLPLLIQQRLDPDAPSAYGQAYRHERALKRDDLERLDTENRAQVETYLANIQIMEHLTRLNTNLALLKMHQTQTKAAALGTLDVEVCALRIGNFRLVTFPGELTVQIGLNLKKAFPSPNTYVSGYTNGYIYYTPTVEQRSNTGYAQEDCDTLVAPEWQRVFETTALEMLRGL